MDDLKELAERVERLTNFETPEAVALNNALHNLLPEPKCVQPPNYLRSIDAAMQLVPEDAEWSLEGDFERKGNSGYHCGMNWYQVDYYAHVWTSAATPALALCAAALRARLQQGEGG